MMLVHEIMLLFDDLLEEKGIEIPCEDETEQANRHDGGNESKLYGMEYWNLADKIESLISGYPCRLNTSMGGADGELLVQEDGSICVTSEQLDNYLENYSME